MTNYLITQLDGTTFHECLDLDALCFPVPWGRPQFLEAFRENADYTTDGLVALSGRHVVGFALVRHHRDHATVLRLAVDPAHRRCGIGSELLRHAEGRMAAGRCRRGVFVPVPEHSLEALRWAQANGYEGVGIERGWYGDADGWLVRGPVWKVELAKVQTQEREVVV